MLLRETDNKSIQASAAALSLVAAPERLKASLCVIRSLDTGRVLVTHRAKDDQLGLPCGKEDAGEGAREAAYRELQEETGVTFSDLQGGLSYIQTINFKGAVVSVYSGTTPREVPVGPANGFEEEGPASWMDPKEIAATVSRFQDFNTVVLFNAGLI